MSSLSLADVQARLRTQRIGRSLTLLATTGSTNDDARRAASDGAGDGHTVVADAQTAGRGSRGRSWLSPPGTDLYVSVIAHVALPLASLPPLTLAVGLAVAEALEPFLPAACRPEVKWPNDVWVDRQKVAGVLVEGASLGARPEPLVIGIGINVNRATFPDDLPQPATSLARVIGQEVDRVSVLVALFERLELWIDRSLAYGASPAIAALAPRLAMRGERARCDDLEGVVEGVDSTGALVLRTAAGLRTCVAGTLRPCGDAARAPA